MTASHGPGAERRAPLGWSAASAAPHIVEALPVCCRYAALCTCPGTLLTCKPFIDHILLKEGRGLPRPHVLALPYTNFSVSASPAVQFFGPIVSWSHPHTSPSLMTQTTNGDLWASHRGEAGVAGREPVSIIYTRR